jgi:hypothetical protein
MASQMRWVAMLQKQAKDSSKTVRRVFADSAGGGMGVIKAEVNT